MSNKSDSKAKKDQEVDTEQKEEKSPNKITKKAGLHIDVNKIKNKLKEYYSNQDKPLPKFGGSQVAFAAVLEKLLEVILKKCSEVISKGKNGLCDITQEAIKNIILLRNDLKDYFFVPLHHYNPDLMYQDQMPINNDIFSKIVEKINTQICVTPKAKNLLYYLLVCTFTDLANKCFNLMAYAKRKSLDGNCVFYSVSCSFKNELEIILKNEIARALKACDLKLEENDNVDSKAKDEEDDSKENVDSKENDSDNENVSDSTGKNNSNGKKKKQKDSGDKNNNKGKNNSKGKNKEESDDENDGLDDSEKSESDHSQESEHSNESEKSLKSEKSGKSNMSKKSQTNVKNSVSQDKKQKKKK